MGLLVVAWGEVLPAGRPFHANPPRSPRYAHFQEHVGIIESVDNKTETH